MTRLSSYRVAAGVLLVMSALQLLNAATGYSLNQLGLIPRYLPSLHGVLIAPWLHGSWGHLLSNLLPLALMSVLVMRDGVRRYAQVSLMIIIGSGLLVWVLGRPGLHVGASGWVFGLWAYILACAWFRRSIDNLMMAGLVLILYGGMVFGFLPQRGISFEYHLAGALAGVVAAWVQWGRKRS